jgi:hypothetical protein
MFPPLCLLWFDGIQSKKSPKDVPRYIVKDVVGLGAKPGLDEAPVAVPQFGNSAIG